MHGATTMAVFRIVHILTGVFWVGTTLFIAGFLLPVLRAAGPAAGPIMEQIAQVRRLPLYMMAVTILSILSGFWLYWRDSNGFEPAWMHSGPGVVFGAGAAFGVLAAAIGMAVNSPTGRRLGALAAAAKARGGPPIPAEVVEMQRLQTRLARATGVVALLLVLATVAMAVARYVP